MIFQYKCLKCSSVFEHMSQHDLACVFCDSEDVKKMNESLFKPSKFFCPHDDKDLDLNNTNNLKNVVMPLEGCKSCKCEN